MRDADGLFEVEPGEPKRPQARPAAVGKRFRAFDPHQVLLLPPSLDDWLPKGHLARFVAELVDEVLDLSAVLADYTEKRGFPPYDPRLMVGLKQGPLMHDWEDQRSTLARVKTVIGRKFHVGYTVQGCGRC